MKRFALAGNPNCGKTTLFNNLTGSTAYVGNWAQQLMLVTGQELLLIKEKELIKN